MTGTLHTAYYLDKGYENSITIWGEKGWLRFDPRKLVPQPNLYDLCLQAAVDFARGAAPPFMTTTDSLAVLRAIFAAYRSAQTGVSQSAT
jgi:predicted dehydrogenase